MTRSFMPAVLIASALAAPAFAFAQDNPGLTRAEVKAQLVQVERAGYDPTARDNYYPADIQAAEARIDAQNGTNAASAYGPSTEGTSASGMRATTAPEPVETRNIYSGH